MSDLPNPSNPDARHPAGPPGAVPPRKRNAGVADRYASKSIAIPTASVLLVFVVGAGFAVLSPLPRLQALGMELFKLAGQVFVVAVAGGFLVQEYNRRRERQAAVNEFRRQVLRDLSDAYGKAKRARRALRAKSRITGTREDGTSDARLSLRDYEQQMSVLSEAQLELEIIVHQLNTFEESFEDRGAIRNQITKMQDYLDRLTDCLEEAGGTSSDQDDIALRDLTFLPEFLSQRPSSQFRARFTKRFQ